MPRSVFPDGTYHVVSRGVEQRVLYKDDDDFVAFLRVLAETTTRFEVTVHALCLMTNHYHAVVESTRVALSNAMHHLNGTYAQRFNRRHGRWGHLFGDRFWCRPIESEGQLALACAYVVANPVRAGLCESPGDWPWSHSRYGLELDPQ